MESFKQFTLSTEVKMPTGKNSKGEWVRSEDILKRSSQSNSDGGKVKNIRNTGSASCNECGALPTTDHALTCSVYRSKPEVQPLGTCVDCGASEDHFHADNCPSLKRICEGQLHEGTEELSESMRQSKREQIITVYKDGMKDIADICATLGVRPSFAAQVLQAEGLIEGYFDLYTTTPSEQNVYSRFFRNVLAFKDADAALGSVQKT